MDNEIATVMDPDSVRTRAEIAWDMMLAGKHEHEICEALGYQDRRQILDDINKQLRVEATFFEADERQKLLRMSLYRLDALRGAVWPGAMMGDPQSVDKALKIEAQYMKAAGTDMPDTQINQHNVLVVAGVEAEYVARLKELADD